jgi:uncharacterized protein
MNWLNFRRIYDALGYEFNHVEIDPSTQADALEGGSITGAVAYTTAGRSLAAYWRETELRTDVKMINPVRGRDREADRRRPHADGGRSRQRLQQGCRRRNRLRRADLFAYNCVRTWTPIWPTACWWPSTRPATAGRVRSGLRADGQGLRRHAGGGISANPDIPVHAGLARFLQEHNAWNDSWTIAE